MQLQQFFEALWADYIKLAPQAEKIMALFETTYGTPILNDHVAFRTFGQSAIAINKLAPVIESFGYIPYDHYHFTAKKLQATSYAHKSPKAPLIFLSELQWWDLSTPSQTIIKQIIDAIELTTISAETFFSGILWPAVSYEDYSLLAEESEYASWLAAHGLHANHFTVSVNTLPVSSSINDVVNLLEDAHFELNEAGGKIKGEKSDLLMQASTMAPSIEVALKDKVVKIPGCYYEFAERFQQANGKLFQGFVPASADKIFESTHQTSQKTH